MLARKYKDSFGSDEPTLERKRAAIEHARH